MNGQVRAVKVQVRATWLPAFRVAWKTWCTNMVRLAAIKDAGLYIHGDCVRNAYVRVRNAYVTQLQLNFNSASTQLRMEARMRFRRRKPKVPVKIVQACIVSHVRGVCSNCDRWGSMVHRRAGKGSLCASCCPVCNPAVVGDLVNAEYLGVVQ